MKYCWLMLFSLMAIAEEAPKALDVSPSTTLSARLQLSEATLKLDAILLDGKQLQSTEIQNLRTRSGGTGGDDVGNGGDELRKEFLFLGDQILQEMEHKELRNKLEAVLNIRRVLVVNSLSVRRGNEEFKMKSVAVEGVILLDAAAWSPIDGLLSPGHDPRFEMLKLMAEAQGLNSTEEQLLHSWHVLSPRQGQIWCPVQIERTKLSVITKDFEATHATSIAGAEEAALELCQVQGYANCRIAESSVRGFGAAKPYANVQGQKFRAELKSSSEIKQERCEAVRQCETVHEWAPSGQVRPAAFVTLEREASKSCR